MTIQSEHDQKDPETGEFEKLEFLPEQPDPIDSNAARDTPPLEFAPDPALSDEPPISFSPPSQTDTEADRTDLTEIDIFGQPAADLDVETPFELFGTSLFDDLDAGPDEPLEFDLDEPDDDLEF